MLYVPFVLSLSLARATAGTLGFSKRAKRTGHNNPLHPPKSVLLLTHQHRPQKGNHHVRAKARESQSVLPACQATVTSWHEEDLIDQHGHCADCEVQAVQGNKEKLN